MPASRSSPPNRRVTPTDTECQVCHKVINRAADLKRHMKNHDPNAEKFRCPEPGCGYSSLQKSNLKTHSNQHNNKKPHKCPDCDFETSDPGALTRHRERRHEYDPFGRRAAKRQAKEAEAYKGFKPYKKPRASTRRNAPAPDAPVAGPSNHATALETPPIATLEQWNEEASSDSSDAESVKTDQFYPSSVSSEGYDNFAGLIAMTPQPQTPPPSQLFLSSPAPQQVPEFKFESHTEFSSVGPSALIKSEASEPNSLRANRFVPYNKAMKGQHSKPNKLTGEAKPSGHPHQSLIYENTVAGPSNHATPELSPDLGSEASSCPSPYSSNSFEHSDIQQGYYFLDDFGFNCESSSSDSTDGEEVQLPEYFTKGQSTLFGFAQPQSPKSDSGSEAGPTFASLQSDSPLPSSHMKLPLDSAWAGDFTYPQEPTLYLVSEGPYGAGHSSLFPLEPQFADCSDPFWVAHF